MEDVDKAWQRASSITSSGSCMVRLSKAQGSVTISNLSSPRYPQSDTRLHTITDLLRYTGITGVTKGHVMVSGEDTMHAFSQIVQRASSMWLRYEIGWRSFVGAWPLSKG